MDKEQYLRKLSSYGSLSMGFKAYLKFILQESAFKKSKKVSLPDNTLGAYCYLASGSARVYLYEQEQEREMTLLFLSTGQMLPDLQAVAGHFKGMLQMEFLEESTLFHIPEKHTANIRKLFGEADCLMNSINAESWAKTMALLTGLKVLTADERLEKLLESFPGIFAVSPVKDVASYLGIHPTTLSAMRNKK